MRKLFVIILIILSANNLFSQKEYYNWYFGSKAGLTFNTTDLSPKFLDNSEMISYEACATVSDREGKLLFYSNGQNIWNSKHEIIAGADSLEASLSSTQILFIRQPGHLNIFYMISFTTLIEENDEMKDSTWMLCTLIDSDKNGGAGEVIGHWRIDSGYSEKVAAVRHSNGRDFWIVTHKLFNNTFEVYLLTPEGLERSSVQSIGSDHYNEEKTKSSGMGYMKFSPDGKRLALCLGNSQFIEIFDFDSKNGTLHNPVKFTFNSRAYGLEFSPDCSKLYFSGSKWIFQLDLEAGNPDDIFNSTTLIYEDTIRSFWAMQSGPDGRIYTSVLGCDFLSVINNPNEKGTECNFEPIGIKLMDKTTKLGLPENPSCSYNLNKILIFLSANTICYGDTLFFMNEITGKYPSDITWHGPDNFFSKEFNPVIPDMTVEKEGWYTFTAIFKDSVYVDSIYIEISAVNAEIETDGNIFCHGDSVILRAMYQEPGNTYLWSTGEKDREIMVRESGKYWLKVTNESGCNDSTGIDIYFAPKPEPQIIGDNIFCQGDSLILSADKDYATYEWSNGGTGSDITISTPGTYWLKVTNEHGCTGYDEFIVDMIEFDVAFDKDDIDFDFVSFDDMKSSTLKITNNGPGKIEYTMDYESHAFEISGFTGSIEAGSYENLIVKFTPGSIGNFIDSIYFSILSPCIYNKTIILSGKGKALILVEIPNNIIQINDYVSIPMTVRLVADRDFSTSFNCSAGMRLDAGILNTDITGEINGKKRTIYFPEQEVTITNEKTKIGEISGTVMLGERDYSPVEIIDFTCDNEYIEVDTNGGLLKIFGLCASNLSRLVYFNTTKMDISPNPVSEELIVTIETEENGMLELIIYNLQGAEVYNTSWINSGKTTKQININTNELSNGVYNLVLTSGTNAIRKNIFISK